LVKVTRRVDAFTEVAAYEFDGFHRRMSKSISNSGTETVAGDGGGATARYYYDNEWRIIETRNGSNQATRQWLWGTQYIDELVFMDVNAQPASDNDCDPDVATGSESVADTRYFYHQDRNWNVVALTDYATHGLIVERYTYTPYGEFRVLAGNSSGVELARPGGISSIGNPFAHQGLPFDVEKGSYQNRFREYVAGLHRFGQRDPLANNNRLISAKERWFDFLHLYRPYDCRPMQNVDHFGLAPAPPTLPVWLPCDPPNPPQIRAHAMAHPCPSPLPCVDMMPVPPENLIGAFPMCCDLKCGAYIPDIPNWQDWTVIECIRVHECVHCQQFAAAGFTCGCSDTGLYPDGSPLPTPPPGPPPPPSPWECDAYLAQLKCLLLNCSGANQTRLCMLSTCVVACRIPWMCLGGDFEWLSVKCEQKCHAIYGSP